MRQSSAPASLTHTHVQGSGNGDDSGAQDTGVPSAPGSHGDTKVMMVDGGLCASPITPLIALFPVLGDRWGCVSSVPSAPHLQGLAGWGSPISGWVVPVWSSL